LVDAGDGAAVTTGVGVTVGEGDSVGDAAGDSMVPTGDCAWPIIETKTKLSDSRIIEVNVRLPKML
jgi:hypothetical protein